MKGGSAGRGLGEVMRKPAQLHASDQSNGSGDDAEVIKEVLVDLGGAPRMRRGLLHSRRSGDEAAPLWRTSRRRRTKMGEPPSQPKSLEKTSPGVAKDLLD